MKKAGKYLLTAVPLIVGLALQVVCSIIASTLYSFYRAAQAAASGEIVTQSEVLAGFGGIAIYALIVSQILAFLVFGLWYKRQNKNRESRSLT